MTPLDPRRKWRAILLATLLFVPAYWALLAGLVSVASDEPSAPLAGPYIAFGLMLIPFVFLVLAFASQHPKAPGAVLRAMVLTLLVGIPVSALAADAVTGVVAGMGAGGVAALRADLPHDWKLRSLAVAIASAWVFLTIRVTPDVAVLLAPALPFTASGLADLFAERRTARGAPDATEDR